MRTDKLGYIEWCEPENYLGINWMPMGHKRSCHDCWEAIPLYDRLKRENEWTFEDKDVCPHCGGTDIRSRIHPANLMPTPFKEISRDEHTLLMHCNGYSIRGTNFRSTVDIDQDGKKWDVTFHMWHWTCLAVAKQYLGPNVDVYEDYAVVHRASQQLIVDGTPIRSKRGDVYILRFFRVGCDHSNMETKWVEAHTRQDTCPECGFRAQYDTSG